LNPLSRADLARNRRPAHGKEVKHFIHTVEYVLAIEFGGQRTELPHISGRVAKGGIEERKWHRQADQISLCNSNFDSVDENESPIRPK
jgi:hypothetical protein